MPTESSADVNTWNNKATGFAMNYQQRQNVLNLKQVGTDGREGFHFSMKGEGMTRQENRLYKQPQQTFQRRADQEGEAAVDSGRRVGEAEMKRYP